MYATLMVAVLALGQTAPDADLRAEARELVLQLNASELAQREAAEKALVELGPKVLPFLPRTSSRTPAEVRQRLARIVQAVEKVSARQAVEASTVTLSGELAVPEVFDALEKQTGNQVSGYADVGASIEVDFKDTPYWQALDEVLDKSDLTLNMFSPESNILTTMAKPNGQIERAGNAEYVGLFRFQAVRVQSVRELLNPTLENTRVSINVAWEPRLTPISLSQPFDQITALDENGDELELSAEGRQDVPIQPGMTSVEVDLPFPLPSRDVKKIASLKGEMLAMLPGRVERFEFSRLERASNDDQRRAGVTVTLERVRKAGALYKMWIRVRFDDASNALESYRGWINRNQAYMVAPDGERISPAGSETTLQADNEVGIAYLFDREEGLTGCRFRYETPALIIQMPVKYELKNIELP